MKNVTEEFLRSQNKVLQALQAIPGSLQSILSFIQSATFQGLTRVPPGKQVNEIKLTWNLNGTLATWTAQDADGNTLFTLTFTWNPDGTLYDVVRS